MKSEFPQILTQVQQAAVKGFLADDEAACLYHYGLLASRHGPCLEVGSYCGKSTVFLANACRQNGSVIFALDHHRGSEEQQPGQEYFDSDLANAAGDALDTWPQFQKNICAFGLQQSVVPIVAASEVVAKYWRTPLALVFIDGGHSLQSAEHDFLRWSEFVVSGGILALHDIYLHPEQGGQAPLIALRKLLELNAFVPERKVGSLVILRRY